MSERTQEEIVEHINQILKDEIAPVVDQHGGSVNFTEFKDGIVFVEMSGACSGCAGSTATLKYGVEHILKEQIPEVMGVEGFDDPFSMVDPFYTDPFMHDMMYETIDLYDITDENLNDTNN